MLMLSLLLAATPFPEGLKQPQLARLERFTFPTAEKFDSAWSEHTTQGIPVVRGEVLFGAEKTKGWFALWPTAGVTRLLPVVSLKGQLAEGWSTKSTTGPRWELEYLGQHGTFTVEERLSSELSDVDLIPWTYATTLLASSGPLYDDGAEGDEQLFDVLRGLQKPGDVQAWVKAHVADDALYARFRRFRPMGSCSMDTTPQEAARLYAELAYARGDLGRFLQLQVRIMGDRFDRTAWSSYGEAAHETESTRLLTTGIDVDQFLLGLLISRPGRDEGLWPWRFARSVREAQRQSTITPELKRLALAATSDPYTRLRATQALLYVSDAFLDAPPKRTTPEARRKAARALLGLDLHPVARAWVLASLAE